MIDLKTEMIVLENDRVRLEPLSTLHENDFINYALTEPNTWQYSLVNPGGSQEAMKDYIKFALIQKSENKCYPFVVIEKITNTVAGCTRYYDVELNNQALSIGYTWYGKKFRRTGINRHCKLLLLTHAFEVLNLERVEFRADINNKASIAAMKAIGCIEEGVLRSHAKLNATTRRTSIILSILKEEWFGGVKEEIKKKIY
jgi:N-acetyltransferase